MSKNGLPLPMQYLGSKSRISDWIIGEIRSVFPHCTRLFDVFSGTGSVAVQALSNGFEVSANDIEKYSYCILSSLLGLPKTGLDDIIRQLPFLDNENILLGDGRSLMKELLDQEKYYFQFTNVHDFHWEDYEAFCENTPVLEGSRDIIDKLRSERKWNLFSHYYANTYFGVKQCLQLDTLREFAERQLDHLKNHIIAATLSAMTFGVSSTTHLAQYLRPSSELSASRLIRRRKYNFIYEVKQRLIALKDFNLARQKANVYNLDYLDALGQEHLNCEWIVYVDPPYFKEHYSRYYHVLNTYFLYDFPYLTYNPVTKKITEGRYRLDRNVSDFGKKRSVAKAFLTLFQLCKCKDFKIALSYANTSLVEKSILLSLAEEAGLKHKVKEKALIHSSQGKYENKTVNEYLILLCPL